MITKADMQTLHKLSLRAAAAPVMDDDEIRRTQRLVDMGLARDYSQFAGTRQRVRLRIWGITEQGKAVLEQKALAEMNSSRSRQFSLTPTHHHSHHSHQSKD